MKAAAIGIHSIDDEGNEHYEEITIADTKEFGRWTQTITQIEILDTCLLEHGGTCEECPWNLVGKEENLLEEVKKLEAFLSQRVSTEYPPKGHSYYYATGIDTVKERLKELVKCQNQ